MPHVSIIGKKDSQFYNALLIEIQLAFMWDFGQRKSLATTFI